MLGLVVEIRGDTKDLNKELGSAKGDVGGFGGAIGGTALKMAGLVTVAGAAALVISDLTNAASEDAAQQAKLEAAITAAGAATADSNAQVEAAIAAGQAKAFADDQTREALMSLVTTTGDMTEATGLLASAQDIARFAGVDLATAADAVAKANEGQDGALRKLLPGLEQGATATDTLANAQKAAAGQADAFANSTAGSQAKAADAFAELGETVGSALLPVLDALLPAITPMIQALGKLITGILPLIIPLLKLLGLALGVVASAITKVVEWLTQLVQWLKIGIDWVGNLLSKLGPLKSLGDIVGGIVGGLSTSTAATTATATSRSGRSGGGGGGSITFNITATGDSLETEAAVTRALRRANRLNAGGPSWATR